MEISPAGQKQISPQGLGLNLRLEYIDDILEFRPEVGFIEIIADNWLSDGPHHDKLLELRKSYPISFHCVGMNIGGYDPLSIKYLESIKKLSEKLSPFQVSDHLCFQKNNLHCFHDLLPFPLNKEALELCAERVCKIQDFLGQQLLIENLSYYIEFKSSEFLEVEFFNKLFHKTNCAMLLDLNNLLVNQQNLNQSANLYLDNLDMSRVKELHIAGAEWVEGVLVDTHGQNVSGDCLKLLAQWDQLKTLPILYERDSHLPLWAEHQRYIQFLSKQLKGAICE